jgi:hypothetical protein
VKALNFEDEDVRVSLSSKKIGEGCPYKTITNVAPINNLVTTVSLEH